MYSKIKGGPFTRKDKACPENKSILDLIIISKDLEKHVKLLIIDTDMSITAFRMIDENKVVYFDHLGMVLQLKGLQTKLNMKKPVKNVKWNLNTESSILESLAHESIDDSDMLVKKSEKILTKIKFKAFGCTKEDKELRKLEEFKS